MWSTEGQLNLEREENHVQVTAELELESEKQEWNRKIKQT